MPHALKVSEFTPKAIPKWCTATNQPFPICIPLLCDLQNLRHSKISLY